MSDLLHRQLGLTDSEYDDIVSILGREPRHTELAAFSVMWSEHCSYKSSRSHLGRLPTEAPWVVCGPGENAGVIDVGDGMAVVVRIESHNHPSFVEPYQGAATGVGGIIRDILTMGARPLASFDSLRFGRPTDSKQRWLARGVVAGISGYGNAVGVPTVGGEVVFDDCYAGNPLVNVMCLGIMPIGDLKLARAEGAGNHVLLVGAPTGRDGIGGVSILASAGFDAADEEKRPSVQVGDPFEEKKLIEACLELYARGLVVGVQDLGGAGLSCATSETAANAGSGMAVDLDAVEVREADMPAHEIFTSESQERMLVVVRPDDLDEALAVCARWEVSARDLGTVDDSGRLVVSHQGEVVCDVPPKALDDGVVYDRPMARPARLDELAAADPVEVLPPVNDTTLAGEVVALMRSPNLADTSWAWRQYDHQLFLNTVAGPGLDAAVLRVKGTDRAIAVSVDGIGRYGRLDPRTGAALAVAEACRNVAVVGAVPRCIVDCLNFGNPEKPEVMWEFSEAVDGIAAACDALGVPVVGGNVSFYNETAGRDIDPTPVIGAVGLIEELTGRPTGLAFSAAGDAVLVVGETRGDLGSSEWAWWCHDFVGGAAPSLDLDHEARFGRFLCDLAAARVASSVHDCSTGGVAAALAECALAGSIGCEVDPLAWAPGTDMASAAFAETPGRGVVSVRPEEVAAVEDLAARHGIPVFRAGTVGGDTVLGASLSELRAATATDL
ncbi:MAG: phosphoribosylformylglycinamidine synthase subunit PurL [Acidimicrobiia bacterium]|nr:phosphoribosylformylglycinamidine synthase subunit PurL [Acidimicrobiia bacterium]